MSVDMKIRRWADESRDFTPRKIVTITLEFSAGVMDDPDTFTDTEQEAQEELAGAFRYLRDTQGKKT